MFMCGVYVGIVKQKEIVFVHDIVNVKINCGWGRMVY